MKELSFPKTEPVADGPAPGEIENLIDRIVARQVAYSPLPSRSLEPAPAANLIAYEGERLILLSRTLSGLVDLILVFLFSSGCILAADSVSGMVIFDGVSTINFAVLVISVFFVYSIFFLQTANQTIGMMITNLRVVGRTGKRSTTWQIFIRSAVFLASLLGLGIGLLMACFDQRSECLHDRVSDTHVVRLPSLRTF